MCIMKTKMRKAYAYWERNMNQYFLHGESIFLIHLLERQIHLRERKEYRPLFVFNFRGSPLPQILHSCLGCAGHSLPAVCGSLGGEVRQDPSVWKRSLFQRHPEQWSEDHCPVSAGKIVSLFPAGFLKNFLAVLFWWWTLESTTTFPLLH